jgi:uridylate kinase
MNTVLLKISGELFSSPHASAVSDIIGQIKQITKTHRVNIVIGGGNFFRGAKEGVALGLQQTTADAVGMLATIMNGLMLNDLFAKAGVASTVLSAHEVPGIVEKISACAIKKAHEQNTIIIFVGGTGNPFFSTDTAAIIRGLQTNATTIWKASNVDYIYDADPKTTPQANVLKKLTYAEILDKKLKIMDRTAVTLAQEHNIIIRVFNVFAKDALLTVAKNSDFGSTIQ